MDVLRTAFPLGSARSRRRARFVSRFTRTRSGPSPWVSQTFSIFPLSLVFSTNFMPLQRTSYKQSSSSSPALVNRLSCVSLTVSVSVSSAFESDVTLAVAVPSLARNWAAGLRLEEKALNVVDGVEDPDDCVSICF